MTETARHAAMLKTAGALLAVVLGLGGCAGDPAPTGGSGYAQAPGMSFHYNAEMVGGIGAGTGK